MGNSDILGVSEIFAIDACIGINSFSHPSTGQIGESIAFTGNITGDNYQWEIDGQLVATTKDLNHAFNHAGIYEISYKVESTTNGCINEEIRRFYVLNDNTAGFAMKIGDVANNGGRAYNQAILKTKDGGYVMASLFTAMLYKIDASGNLAMANECLSKSSLSQLQNGYGGKTG